MNTQAGLACGYREAAEFRAGAETCLSCKVKFKSLLLREAFLTLPYNHHPSSALLRPATPLSPPQYPSPTESFLRTG